MTPPIKPFYPKTIFLLIIGLTLLWSWGPAFAVTVETLKEPMKDFKSEIFGGWMMAAKIIAFAGGLVMAIFRSSAAPALTGIGATAGIVFFDKYLGDGATGALI